jgi:hypothetical protein
MLDWRGENGNPVMPTSIPRTVLRALLATAAVGFLVLLVAAAVLAFGREDETAAASKQLASQSGPVLPARELGGALRDAPWPPVPAGDPNPVDVTIPVNWSEYDKEQAREWKAVQDATRTCMRERGLDYTYLPVWPEYDDDGVLLTDPPPPAQWSEHFERPFMSYLDSARVCFSRGLVSIGRQPVGPTQFAARPPRFEESDFADPATLDIPPDWSNDEKLQARRSWQAELITRECMAEAGFPDYGMPPSWLVDDAFISADPWENSLPLDRQEAARTALNGTDSLDDGYDWDQAGCWGRGVHDAD